MDYKIRYTNFTKIKPKFVLSCSLRLYHQTNPTPKMAAPYLALHTRHPEKNSKIGIERVKNGILKFTTDKKNISGWDSTAYNKRFGEIGGEVIVRISLCPLTVGDSPNCVQLNPQLRQAAGPQDNNRRLIFGTFQNQLTESYNKLKQIIIKNQHKYDNKT